MNDLTFKEIEQKMNELLEKTSVSDSADPSYIKCVLFEELKKTFPNLRNIDVHYNRFRMDIPYSHDYLDLKGYDKGEVCLFFALRTKRTDKTKQITRTKAKYVHTKHKSPVQFKGYSVSSMVPSFDWKSESIDNLAITSEKWCHANRYSENVEGHTVNDILAALPSVYEECFRSDVVQPYVKQLIMGGKRKESIFSALPEDLQQAVLDRDSDKIFNGVADFIIDKKLYI